MHSLNVDECMRENIKLEKRWVNTKVFNEDFNLYFHLPDNAMPVMCVTSWTVGLTERKTVQCDLNSNKKIT